MKKIALIASMSGSMLALSCAASFADYTLNILHINDWHSRIESINKYDSTCSDDDETQGACFGGAARLITAIAQRREALTDDNLLVLNAGDNFQGSLFYTTYKGEAEAEFLNQMGFDAMAVGNHEFDDGEEALVPFLDKVEFPVLSANVKPSAASEVGDRIKPSVVIEVGGERIGIVGAVANDTPELASPGPNIAFEEDVATITAEVERLKADGVNKIIALTHVGYPRDLAAIAKIPDVDVVVGGHSHTLLHNSDDKAAGPYPTMVDNPGGYQVPVVQAGSYSKYLGEFSVTFDDAGVVQSASGDPILLDSSFERDEAVVARIKELAGPIEELVAQEVSETTAPIDGDRTSCRARECEMGNLVADAILDRTRDQGVTIAVQNGGGLRASIDEGTITMGEVLAVLPFQNTLATFELSGADLKASIEAGVSEVEDGAGKFPQVAGLKYSFDPSVPPNEGRVQSIEVMEGDSWVPLEDSKTYTIATNNFVRSGGDGYRLFAENAQNAYDYGPSLEQVVADYLADNRPYTPKLDGRIAVVSATGATEDAAEETTAPEPAAEEAAAAEPAAEAPAAEAPAAEETTTSEPAADEAPTEETAAAPEPAAEAPAESADEPMAGQTHVVVAGDSLWELARTFYNDPAQWSRIAEANPGINPNVLTVGQELAIPAAN
ncbi:MAG: 5'-nucleotidase C-terminal domain-containing protein [Rhizobiaceae bacterium]|nr:5'-nucleotidase C-terminal domain-containing protein [Rhizobiaceae bacterium]MCV0406908.1 5'-nucleotidase C-terminal domain-containing protein [Rhizobiaceae bacterium]